MCGRALEAEAVVKDQKFCPKARESLVGDEVAVTGGELWCWRRRGSAKVRLSTRSQKRDGEEFLERKGRRATKTMLL